MHGNSEKNLLFGRNSMFCIAATESTTFGYRAEDQQQQRPPELLLRFHCRLYFEKETPDMYFRKYLYSPLSINM